MSLAPSRRALLCASFALGLTANGWASARAAGEVSLYTTREPGLIQPLLDRFTAETGIKVNTVFLNAGLAERVQAEGTRSPADVLMTVDIGSLVDLQSRGLTQPISSTTLEPVPPGLREAGGHWTALSMRARAILVSRDRITDTAMTYEQLADPRFKSRLCSRSGNHPYNTALIAAMIDKDGAAATEATLAGMKANLARRPAGGDREVARDILAGLCDVGLSNTYYMGLMLSGAGGAEQKRWGEAVRVILPTFKDRAGTHVNVSGAAIAKHAPNRANAERLVSYLLTPAAQQAYAEVNFEYPVRAGVTLHPIIASLGTLKVDSVQLPAIAARREAASMMVDRIGFDR